MGGIKRSVALRDLGIKNLLGYLALKLCRAQKAIVFRLPKVMKFVAITLRIIL